MQKVLKNLLLLFLISCNSHSPVSNKRIISVSISPFKYFVEAIGGEDYAVNVMVPAGADPHTYEPVPGQISDLRNSVAYISDGYLAFEMTWLERFYETNRSMKRLSLADHIDLIKPDQHPTYEHSEGADPHYWVSPKSAQTIALAIKNFLCELKPQDSVKYEERYLKLAETISGIDSNANELFKDFKGKSFITMHGTLAYFARDYSLNQVAVEREGKEPTPSILKEVIDSAKRKHIGVILVQREFDTKSARAISSETGAVLEMIDPLSENWPVSMMRIISVIHDSFVNSGE
jgi:zinc transport system substrate-binding protein